MTRLMENEALFHNPEYCYKMKHGTTDYNRSRLLAVDSLERRHYDGKVPYHRQRHYLKMNLELRDQVEGAIAQSDLLLYKKSNFKTRLKAELVRAHTQLNDNNYYKEQISELKEQLYRFALIEKTLNNVLKDTNSKLRKRNEELKYAQSRLAEADQHTQDMYAELVRIHTQLEDNTYYKQQISELKEHLYRFAWNEQTLQNVLNKTNGKLRESNEELKYAHSRLAEADQHAKEISDVLSQEIRDLWQRLEESESSEHALNIQLQQSRADLKSTKEELKRTQARSNDTNKRASGKDNSHSQDTSDLKKLLEKTQSNERLLQHQLRQTQDDYKKITEQFAKTEIKFKVNSKSKEAELNSLLQQSKEQVNRITRELEDTKTRLNEVNQKANMAEKSLSLEISDLRENIKEFKLINEKLNGKLLQKSEDLRKTTNDLEQARQRLIVANHRESETDNSNSRDNSDLRKLLEKSELNERSLKQQLHETQDNLKKMDEQFAEIKMKKNDPLHGIRIQLKDKSQQVSDLRRMLDISEAKEATFNHQMQNVQDKLQKTTSELEDAKMRLNEARASEEYNSHLQDIRDLKKLLEQSQVNERSLQHQLRQTQDNLKKITEEFEEAKTKETSKARDIEFNKLLQQSKEQVNITTKELQNTQRRLNEVNQTAQMTEKSLTREISELRQKINALKLKNETLNGELQQTKEDLRKTTNEFEEERKRASETDKSNSQETSDMRKLLETSKINERTLEQQLRQSQENLRKMAERFAEIKKQKEAIDGIRIQLNDKSQEVSDLRKMLDISKAKEATFNNQMQHVQDKLQKTTTELEDTKTRLSKFMGQQLTDNNPNITDLSDKNRPTKLSERFSELYDNEWTDAFEVLGSIYNDERTTIITLITILKDADKYCKEEAERQMERLRKALTLNMETGGSDIPSLINKQMKDCRKALATEAGQHLFEVYTKELSQKSQTRDSAKSALRVTAYLREAFMLCWLMTIQDPPVVFDRILQHGEKFNTELYRSYTKSGPLVNFPVWPTMFLHEGGPVLYKGVAQGCHK
ncbi:early endosome antigen 1-like isoform X3 [Dreissena polymorpha]|uniref:early endosome antigen 1-like isoform X3 n=1 Tax=Dreissena polymorpha TaxID=45954 RepID=UPI0022647796|nr:early endosome antigen 1-like isoform X3 [Dreissena polymorpha]